MAIVTRREFWDRLELALYGKTGNTFGAATALGIDALYDDLVAQPAPATVTREREELIARLMALSGRYDMTATERYEADAEAFYRETGYLSPGKDVPMAMGGQDERERRNAYDVWSAKRNQAQQAAILEAAAALASAPPAAPPEDAPRKAEHLLAASGVFKGHEGLRGLANAASFWVDHPYGTRLYYGDGGMDYLHRDVLMSAVRVLDTLAASAAPPDPPSGQIIKSSDQSAARQSDPPGLVANWRPIETAPKRTDVLAGWADRPHWLPQVLQQDDAGMWFNGEESDYRPPTHWMPLPASPQAETKGDE